MWPQFWCKGCKALVRVSRARCTRCSIALSKCMCSGAQGGQTSEVRPQSRSSCIMALLGARPRAEQG
eukprot:11254028-Alexandrium_andersonii.AAC.1